MIRQFELVERVQSYDPSADPDALNKAYVFAMKAHGSQTRASGDPYFSHPLEVAGILTTLKLDCASIITALLHDTVEDTTVTLEEIKHSFGQEIADLVDGVTKLTKLELQSTHTKQAENFRKLILAISKDIRVLLVKLADRVHNMRTIHYVGSEEKQKRIATETLEIFAPLAERIGMHQFRDELQNSAFQVLHPDAWEAIVSRLSFLREQEGDLIQKTVLELKNTLESHGMSILNVYGREKTPYSIWRKMQRRNVSFEQLFDIIAFRIIVPNLSDCYQALGILHSQYPMIPDGFRDYISTPKPNGYQSLHTGIIGPNRQRIEIQIRTQAMHETAELGVAAHWSYKQGSAQNNKDSVQYRWIRELLDILDHAATPEEFLENTKLEMFEDQVFCFTPKGDVVSLPQHATPIDFAYSIHSAIGDHCLRAKVNGRIVPLRAKLTNGDQVEIITSKSPTVSPEWERFVITGKAKARIRRIIRQQQREQYGQLGREIIQKTLRSERHPFSEKDMEKILPKLGYDVLEDMYVAVGSGIKSATEIVHILYPSPKGNTSHTHPIPVIPNKQTKDRPSDDAVMIEGLIPGMALHFAKCCHPMPGDRIVGIIRSGRGVTIHIDDCNNLEPLAKYPERWLSVCWGNPNVEGQNFAARLRITLANKEGGLSTVSTIIAKNKANISNLKITHRTNDFYDMYVDVDVKNIQHFNAILAALRATSLVSNVERA